VALNTIKHTIKNKNILRIISRLLLRVLCGEAEMLMPLISLKATKFNHCCKSYQFEEEQPTQWPKEKIEKDKQRSTKLKIE
jgi:hypothetical protein